MAGDFIELKPRSSRYVRCANPDCNKLLMRRLSHAHVCGVRGGGHYGVNLCKDKKIKPKGEE